MAKKIYVLDTSVCMTDANSLTSYSNNDIIIPFKVLEEIDKHKQRQDSVGANARETIRKLDELRAKGSLKDGIRIAKGKGIVKVRTGELQYLPVGSNREDPDNEIISVALAEQKDNPGRKVTIVSRDINMRIKSDSIGLPSEDYIANQVVKSRSALYSGFKKYLVDEQTIDRFYNGDEIYAEKSEIKLNPNQMAMLVSNANEKKTALARFNCYTEPLHKIVNYSDVWGIRARNKEQSFALELLMDPNVPVVTLIGGAGSGKTLCALATGLQQTLEKPANGDSLYKRIIVSRPI